MSKETVEEYAERFCDIPKHLSGKKYQWSAQDRLLYNTIIDAVKWQTERSYNHQEVNEIISEAWLSCEDNEGETFTQARQRILNTYKKK